MTITHNTEFGDRLFNSYYYIRNIVESSVNFQGPLDSVIVNELHFALGLCGVTLSRRGAEEALTDGTVVRTNMLLDEAMALDQHFARGSRGDAGDEEEPEDDQRASTRVRPRLAAGEGPPGMRTLLRSATRRCSVPIGDRRFDLYYTDEDGYLMPGSKEYLSDANGRLRAILGQLLERLDQHRGSGLSSSDRLPDFERKSSDYINIVLGKLKTNVLSHLRSHQPDRFPANEFTVQYFLQTYVDGALTLRYCPLAGELLELGKVDRCRRVRDALNAQERELLGKRTLQDFITNYDWAWQTSFVGYALKSQCALYLNDWKDEPFVDDPKAESPRAEQERGIATEVMQHFRGDTPHQFIVPFFYGQDVYGLMLINCKEPIHMPDRSVLIRAVQDVGPQIYMAFASDRQVNHVIEAKRKAAAARAYKYLLMAMLHEDARFCRKALEFATQYADDPLARKLIFMALEKRQAVEEYKSDADPIRHVNDALIYPRSLWRDDDEDEEVDSEALLEQIDIPLAVLRETFTLVQEIYNPNERVKVSLDIPKGGELDSLGRIPNFQKWTVARLMLNLIKNTVQACPGQKRDAEMKLEIDLVTESEERWLQVVATDNCGGFEEPFLRELSRPLTVDSYIAYLNRKEDEREREESQGDQVTVPQVRGMGFLIIARYTNTTRGRFIIENHEWPGAVGQVGARVTIKMPLRAAEERSI